jgi:subtilase family serine protease
MTSRFWSRIIVVCTAASLFGQTHDRLAARIDSRLTVTLESSVDPRIKDLIDGGPVDPHEPVRGISFRFRPSPEQSAALQQLLEDQQNPDSPRYHDWLTPEQFADQFGLSDADYGRVREWIESEGFQIDATARSRTYIVFSGTAAQVQGTFGAELHRYSGHGETHLASATAARLPADLAPLVYGIRGLDDFKARASGRAKPRFIDAGNGSNGLGPGDLAVIYDINPLYQKGLDGTGQKIAVVGQSELHVSDVQLFRDEFKLPANDPHLILVPGYPDPGIVEKDFDEANADVQFAGMAAPKASVYYVYSQHVYYSEQYAVDQNIAPVISDSYGLCEKVVLAQPQFADLNRSMVQQANAQGITWIGITGDTGPAGCEYQTTDTAGLNGFSTRMIGSVPEVTAVGGTRFNEGSGNYWSADQAAGHVSALSYIPEVVWNDTAHDGTLAASGGGASIFFPKPAWQTGPGVPNDNRRHVPDIAFAASWDHDYYVFAEKGTFWFYGGTSSAAPFFAGAVALLNQYLVAGGYQSRPGLGNINPKLYQLAQTTSGVFHDITSGDTIIPCKIGTPDCTTGSYGFRAGPGYDEATGLGSIDIYNLFLAWTGTSSTPHTVVTTLTASANPVQIS